MIHVGNAVNVNKKRLIRHNKCHFGELRGNLDLFEVSPICVNDLYVEPDFINQKIFSVKIYESIRIRKSLLY